MEFTNLEAEQPSDTPKPYQNFQNYASTEDTKTSTSKEKTRPTPKEPVKKGICGSSIVYDDSYIRRFWEGRLKVFELIVTLVAMIILPNTTEYYALRYIFYRVVCTTAFACIAIDLLLHLLSQWKKLPEAFKSTKFLLGMTLTASVSFLATASLVLVVADVSKNERDALVASFCGFLATIAFVLESFLYFLKTRSENLYRVD